MSTENENWRDASSSEENSGASRDGNQFNREGGYNRPSYNRESGDRPYRPRFNSDSGDRPQRPYSSDRPYRPRFTPNSDNGERPQRSYNSESGDRPQRTYNSDRPSYGNNAGGDRPYRPRFNSDNGDRPQRSYNSEGGDRPQRTYNNDRPSYGNNAGGDRPYRPRYNSDNGDRPQRPYSTDRPQRPYSTDRPQRPYSTDRPQRPYNNDRPSYGNNAGGDRPFRPHYNSDNGDRPQRPYGDNAGRPRYNSNDGGRPGGYGNRDSYSRPVRRTDDYDPNSKYSRKKQIEYKEQFTDPDAPIRLNKFLANAGVCSRREADEFIAAGVVLVNGVAVTELGTKIKRSDEVKFHDQAVSIERKIYVLLNKPKDTVTTSDDPQARRTVMDLVKGACSERIYPVGRLDRNTTGVLLLTNDGDLASKLTHPKFLKKKIYHVHLDKNLTKADMEQIATGVQLDDGEIHADVISYTDDFKKDEVGIEIHSGKNRVVRRIFESLGYKVMKLDRVFFAGLTKKGLRRGEWRYLTENEVSFLRMGSFE